MRKLLFAVLVLGIAFAAFDSAAQQGGAQQGGTGPTFPAGQGGGTASPGTPALPPVADAPRVHPPDVAVVPGREANPAKDSSPVPAPPSIGSDTR